MTFAEEEVGNGWVEAQDLIRQHHDEVGALPSKLFAPDLAQYQYAQDAGALRCFTLRNHGRLSGYATFFVRKHLHYPSVTLGMQDVLFVHPELRGLPAVRFIEWQDEQLQSQVDAIGRAVTERRDFSKTLKGLGYEPIERTFLRRLA